jgi:hypothetical protein
MPFNFINTSENGTAGCNIYINNYNAMNGHESSSFEVGCMQNGSLTKKVAW